MTRTSFTRERIRGAGLLLAAFVSLLIPERPCEAGCTYSVSPASASIGIAGATGQTFTLTIVRDSGSNCAWTATPNGSGLSVTGGGSGNGGTSNGTTTATVTYSVAANAGAPRSGTIDIIRNSSGNIRASFVVDQDGCTFTLAPASDPAASPAGSSGTFAVTASGASCTWTATSNNTGWLHVTSGASGTGNGTVSYTVDPNTGSALRTGTITAGGQTFTVTQTVCQFTLTPTSVSVSSAGKTGTFLVNTSDPSCPWTATSNATWLTVTVGASGTGNGAVGYTVDANTGAQRTGTITAGGQTFTVTQGCVTLVPTSASVLAPASTGTFSVVAGVTTCTWTATSNASWLTVVSGGTGPGSKTVGYSVAANTGSARTGTITVGVLTFTVRQASSAEALAEGYDPLRQITTQVMKANLLILLDVTGSMVWYPDSRESPTKGDDSRGNLFWSTASSPGNGWSLFSGKTFGSVYVPSEKSKGAKDSTDASSSCSSNCRFWYYVLVYEGPSRMATVKNALGNSIDLVRDYTPPLVQSSLSNSSWSSPVSPATVTITPVPQSLVPAQTTTNYVSAWLYTYDYGTYVGGSPNTTRNKGGAAPGTPFNPFDADNFPLLSNGTCSVGTCTYSPPLDLLGTNQDRINWGLTKFSTDGSSTLVQLDTTGNNKDLPSLEDYLYFSGSQRPGGTGSVNGLSAGGSTNTITGFTLAKTEILRAANSDSKIDLRCSRPYGVVLVTDGMSNFGNPNGNWIDPCGAGPTQCDTGGGTDDCPSNWAQYAAQGADDLFTSTTARNFTSIPVRTWTIGVSSAVGPCELDYIAYRGRTDAKSPKGDTGWSGYHATNNPYIPNPAASEPADPRTNYASSQYDGPAGQYFWNRDSTLTRGSGTPTYAQVVTAGKTFDAAVASGSAHGHNAFFATTADELGAAFVSIVAASATGDYSTSAPLSGAGATASNVVILPSTDYPAWRGHLYAYDSAVVYNDRGTCSEWLTACYGGSPDNSKNPCIPCLKWDAGLLLTQRTSASRKIYTWLPTGDNTLVEVITANAADLKTIDPGLASMTTADVAAVIDFIRGNDGAGSPRAWRLGPMINSTPSLIAGPPKYTQNTVNSLHQQFQLDHQSRTPLLWVGASDGMLHAFRLSDGYEQMALLPPALLAKQRTLYDNFKNLEATVTGQPTDIATHVYGVANSLRFGDVYFPSVGGVAATFKTVGFLALGPGGSELTAIDFTDPAANTPPVKILWRKTTADLSGLFDTWSLPALAPVTSNSYRLIVGGGVRKENNRTAQSTNTNFVTPVYYVLNPVDGTVKSTSTMTSTASSAAPAPLVGNQGFADSVFLNTAAKYYQEDNLAGLGIQADLNGRIWFTSGGVDFPTSGIGINATAATAAAAANENQQPIYYPPAASGYAQNGGCDVFAFASGTLYEKSTMITGPDIGTTPSFEPSLYVATAPKPATAGAAPVVPATSVIRKKINSLVAPTCPVTPNPNDPPCVSNPNAGFNLSNNSQVTAAPYLLVPKSGAGSSKAFFLVYDPDNGCNGFSYVVQLDVTNDANCAPTVATPTVYGIGVGAASGFTITEDKVRIAKSGIGIGQRATISTVPGVTPSSGGSGSVTPLWWRELK